MQNFVNESRMAPAQRLAALRAALVAAGLDGFLVPRADEHLGEYVPPSAERLAWLTGFTGSAGLAVVLADQAVLFTDGRYILQAETEADPALWQLRHLIDEPPATWLAAAAPGVRIGYDPWLIGAQGLARFRQAGVEMVALASNPVDAIWRDRPAPPASQVVAHPVAYAGRSDADKRAEIAGLLAAAKDDALVVSDPASLAWLLNIRGTDVPFTPFALGFALLHRDTSCDLFLDPARLAPGLAEAWGAAVRVAPRSALSAALAALAGKRVRVDPAGTAAWFGETLRAAGAEIDEATDPILLPKACKNAVEQDGARHAQARDAVALCRFLHWLAVAAPQGGETELSAATQLLDYRGTAPEFHGESFPAISGAGPNGAVIHYRVTPVSNRAIQPDEVYLIDSGGQYPDGTTDVTRTIWTGPGTPPAELVERYTRVLQGHIAIATLCFPRGIAGPHIDALARRALWQIGLDYDHGTGHGVGSYLSVHEGPAGISRTARPVPLAEGMILSNEPGYYQSGSYGIRLENLLLVQSAPALSGNRPFLRFETLTLAPFDRSLIAPGLLSAEERAWLDFYHARVLAEVGMFLDRRAREWLATACARL
jgi:Xaa-Pro aminopeptidase